MECPSSPLPASFSHLFPPSSARKTSPMMELPLIAEEEDERDPTPLLNGEPHNRRRSAKTDVEEDKRTIVRDQAQRLFKLCDKDRKGFIVRADLDNLDGLFPLPHLEEVFALADRQRVNLVYERDFLGAIVPLLLAGSSPSGIKQMNTEFRRISLPGVEKKHSAEEWTQMQKLRIAIDSGVTSTKGLANLSEQNSFLANSPTSLSENSVTGLELGCIENSRGISLHDDLLSAAAAQNHDSHMSNGVSTLVSLAGFSSPESIDSPVTNSMQFFKRRATCAQMSIDETNRNLALFNSQQEIRLPERIFKVVFVGDSAVGKTCFLHRFCHNRFKPLFNATIGVDFTVKTLNVRDRLVAVQLWDTAGQERFRSITKQYFRKADGVVLCYDVTSEMSFINVRNWIESVRMGVDDGCVLALVGNKIDLYPNEMCRTITRQHGEELAKEFDMIFFETSAFTGQGIVECMQALALRLQTLEDEHLEELIKLEAMLAAKKRSWCCI